jgi:hypothetical protein
MSLELLFVVHGAFVAYFIMQKDQPGAWAMFFFGGVTLFLITQMHGLGLSRRGKLFIALPLAGIMVTYYLLNPGTAGLLPRVPMINYIGTILVMIVVWLLLRFGDLVKWLRADAISVRE